MFHLRSTGNAATKTLYTEPPSVEFCYDKSYRQPIVVKKIQHRVKKEISAEMRAV